MLLMAVLARRRRPPLLPSTTARDQRHQISSSCLQLRLVRYSGSRFESSTVVGDTQLMPSYLMPLPPPADPQLADIRAAVDGLRVLAGIETVIVEPCADAATLSSSVEAKFADQVRGSALSVAVPIKPRPFPYI